MTYENGEVFIKSLAQFVRTHEKALANALQLRRERIKNGAATAGTTSPTTPTTPRGSSLNSTSNTFASAFSFGSLSFTSHSVKPAKLTLTPHHLFYLLSRFEELDVPIGPMSVRIENLHAEPSPANYVSFLSKPPQSRGRSDRESIHSVSSVRSVMSNMTSFWSSLGLGGSNVASAKTEKAQAQARADLKYLYSAFTKIPCLRLSPDRRARLISGYEEFPFDTAVPLVIFKTTQALEICDLDFRQFYGWDVMADRLRSLTIKRGQVDDPTDLFVHIVLDDMEKRRRRSSKPQSPPTPIWPASPLVRNAETHRMDFSPGTTESGVLGSSASPRNNLYLRSESDAVAITGKSQRNKSASPARPASSRHGTPYRHVRTAAGGERIKRSGSGSSNSSTHSLRGPSRDRSLSNLLSLGILPTSKWDRLRHLSLADNGLTTVTASSMAPLANTLQSLDLSSNLFVDVPDGLVTLTALRALNLSNCMISSLHSLAKNPLPAITALNLRANRLASLAGVERLRALERLDLRANRLEDPVEMARLTGLPNVHELWVADNPFIRSHGGTYRIIIFNLFRTAPGFTEDILIDATGPGYGERRQLRERATEPDVPVVRPPVPDDTVPAARTPSAAAVAVPNPLSRPLPQTAQSDITLGPVRRKKGPRRRMVDLAGDDSPSSPASRPSPSSRAQTAAAPTPETPEVPPRTSSMNLDGPVDASQAPPAPSVIDDPFITTPAKPPATVANSSNTLPQTSSTASPINPSTTTKTTPASPPLARASNVPLDDSSAARLARELQGLSFGGETYRRRVEALKDEFGPGWLHVLSQESAGRNEGPPPAAGPEPAITPPHILRPDLGGVRSPSQGIVGGSRTLG